MTCDFQLESFLHRSRAMGSFHPRLSPEGYLAERVWPVKYFSRISSSDSRCERNSAIRFKRSSFETAITKWSRAVTGAETYLGRMAVTGKYTAYSSRVLSSLGTKK